MREEIYRKAGEKKREARLHFPATGPIFENHSIRSANGMTTQTAPTTPGIPEEFERTPVSAPSLKGIKSFVGMYAGEHVAGTEFMIGPLFLAAGVSAFDLLVGLLVGNLLAVLSWTLVCAPVRGYTALWSKVEGIHAVSVWHSAQSVGNCAEAWFGLVVWLYSGVWQPAQVFGVLV